MNGTKPDKEQRRLGFGTPAVVKRMPWRRQVAEEIPTSVGSDNFA
jgi:hypothetical protein